VKNTVGKLLGNSECGTRNEDNSEIPNPKSALKKVTPKEVTKIRVLDPACGSGSFLIGAFQYLLDWHLQWYSANDPESWTKKKHPPIFNSPTHPLADSPSRNYRLTTAEKKRILLNNIYGVDIDPQAVEVTKLSLLLKVLEGESDETLSKQLKLFQERALPDLGNNIKCGNSLIGPDFYDDSVGAGLVPAQKNVKQQKLPLLNDDEERYRINVFDWKAEFPHIFPSPSPFGPELMAEGKGEGRAEGVGGFDAVIGNPPYVFGRDWKALNISDQVKKYLGKKYKSSPYQLDMFSIFYGKSF
jgi:hypothetical protein